MFKHPKFVAHGHPNEIVERMDYNHAKHDVMWMASKRRCSGIKKKTGEVAGKKKIQ